VKPDPAPDVDRELALLESELKRLEAEYNMYFAGRLPRPPLETRSRVAAMVKRLDRTHLGNYGDRFRLSTLQSRFSKLSELWDRALRAREEGRRGPFAQPRPVEPARPEPAAPETRVMHVATFSDPRREAEKVQDLYESLADARRAAGEEPIPYHRFADLIATQVATLKDQGSREVAFRVAMTDGKVTLSARALKGEGRSQGKGEAEE
jgi:hypothetical protein